MNKTYLDFANRCKNTFLPYAIECKAAYLNYIDSTVQNWQQAYYGDNYHRLQKVKDAWDPTNFFHFDQSIELTGTKNHRKKPVKHSPLHGGFVIPFPGHPIPQPSAGRMQAQEQATRPAKPKPDGTRIPSMIPASSGVSPIQRKSTRSTASSVSKR
ncbi:BBE-domain-containing protein [Agrocybe pediades]|nr:BBE-domain-containing protein [Agrocybe pediades]